MKEITLPVPGTDTNVKVAVEKPVEQTVPTTTTGENALLNFNAIIDGLKGKGGVKGMAAALSEGYCPVHQRKLAPVPDLIEAELDSYPTTPLAHGWCGWCPGAWTYGTSPDNPVQDGDWIAIDNISILLDPDREDSGVNRRLLLNGPIDDCYDEDDE